MTGPARAFLTRSTLPSTQPGHPRPDGRPSCWRDREHDDGACCALTYTPAMQRDLLDKSPGCADCWAGVNAAVLYHKFRTVPE